jgi:transcriptional regulator with XRE-family HTH domain
MTKLNNDVISAAELGHRIRKKRKELGMTQKEFSERIGVSNVSVSDWERGSLMPKSANLHALAVLFGTTSEDLLNPGQLALNIDDEPNSKDDQLKTRLVPLIPKSAIIDFLVSQDGEWPFASEMLQQISVSMKAGPRSFGYVENNPSMPWIPKGTPILIDPDLPIDVVAPARFEYFLFNVGLLPVLGQLNRTPSGMFLQFMRSDPGWEPIKVEMSQYLGRFLACDFGAVC